LSAPLEFMTSMITSVSVTPCNQCGEHPYSEERSPSAGCCRTMLSSLVRSLFGRSPQTGSVVCSRGTARWSELRRGPGGTGSERRVRQWRGPGFCVHYIGCRRDSLVFIPFGGPQAICDSQGNRASRAAMAAAVVSACCGGG